MEDTIKDMFNSSSIPSCFKVADLGCSSGPNTFLAISKIIDTIHGLCQKMNCESPDFQVFLNDLPDNDFNSVFKLIPTFYEDLKKQMGDKLGRVFIAGVPGSFHGRLFPGKSIDLFRSSNSLHWLSQVPDGLENNKGCIYMSKKSPPAVFTNYLKQFQRDFSMFLRARANEIVPGGCMVLEFNGRSSADPTCKDCYYHWQLLADLLFDMAKEELLNEADVDTLNLPYYSPYAEELKMIIQEDGSFDLKKLDFIEVDCNLAFNRSGEMAADNIRAAVEPMLTSHFGEIAISDLFSRFGKSMSEYLSESPKVIMLTISLAKK